MENRKVLLCPAGCGACPEKLIVPRAGRYAPACRRLAYPPSMVCGSPTQELAGPASCAAGQ